MDRFFFFPRWASSPSHRDARRQQRPRGRGRRPMQIEFLERRDLMADGGEWQVALAAPGPESPDDASSRPAIVDAVPGPVANRQDPLADGSTADRFAVVRSVTGEGEPTSQVPVLRLTKDQGYGRIVQQGIHLQAGTVYTFTCRIRGVFQASPNDHVPHFWSVEANYSDATFDYQDGWTTATRSIVPQTDSDDALVLALWDWSRFEVTDLALRTSPDGENLLQNGDLAQGLEHWEAWGGTIELATVDATPVAPRMLDGEQVEYTRFDGTREELYAFHGAETILLIPPPDVLPVDLEVVRQLVSDLDASWDYYHRTMGREPFSFSQRITVDGQPYVTGLPTLAVVEETCGAGCGMVGAADIEIGLAIWEQTYRNFLAGDETRGVFEYEMGRNYWSYGGVFHSSEAPSYHLATAFATIYGYQAGVAAGSTEEPGHELVDWVRSYRQEFDRYLAAPDWNVIRSGGGQGEKILGGMWLYFAEIYGEGFHGRFFRAANGLPAATSLNDAIANYELAASVAAGENLYGVFVATLKYPEIPGLSDRILQTLEHRARPVLAHDDAFAIFHDAQDMRLDLLGNDPGAPDGQTRLTIIAVDGPDPQGRATVARGGSHIAYTPRPGFYGTETWTYTVADAFGNVDDARVVMDVSKRWQNPLERHDVNGDGTVTPLDVLLVINAINSGVLGSLPAKPTGALAWLAYLDATGDGQCTPGDVLTVINRLNSRTTSAVSVSVHGEGEAGAAGVLDRAGTDSWERAWLSESRAHLEDVLRPWDRLPACLSCPV